jgi:hypothetical protein
MNINQQCGWLLVRCGRTKNSAACFVVQQEVLHLVVCCR